ncbi:MAG: hypothetical protein HDR18_06125 [Lachnospiraceae bacterium]|nr:hypothetical protein [Lachnospiraceae bacterium]
MMNQYKQETSQIHAPADLIRRTKQAMQEEELRLQREKTQAAFAAWSPDKLMQESEGINADLPKNRAQTDRQSVISSGKIYRWALPVAAAAMVLLLINVTSGMVGKRFNKSASGAAPASDDTTAYDMAEAAAEETFDDADMTVAEQKYSEGIMADQSADRYENSNAGAAYDSGADMAAAEDNYEPEEAAEAAEYEDDSIRKEIDDGAGMNNMDGISEDVYAADLTVTEVAEAPVFVDDEDTECIMVHGIRVYVIRESNGQWSAYARVNQVNYVVTGGENITDAENYAVKAYEWLTENVAGTE